MKERERKTDNSLKNTTESRIECAKRDQKRWKKKSYKNMVYIRKDYTQTHTPHIFRYVNMRHTSKKQLMRNITQLQSLFISCEKKAHTNYYYHFLVKYHRLDASFQQFYNFVRVFSTQHSRQ